MSAITKYKYAVLRYRHDPLAEEFANIGVLLFAADVPFLSIKVRQTYSRLKAIFPDFDAQAYKRSVTSVKRAVDQFANRTVTPLFANSLDIESIRKSTIGVDDSSIVWSELGSGVTADPISTLDELYDRFVSRYDETHKPLRSDSTIWRPVRDKLAERNLGHHLTKKTIRSRIDEVEFDHAWKNGAWHCYQPLSFDLATADTIKQKAHRWVGQLVGIEDAIEEFQPNFLVGQPTNVELNEAFFAAVEILRRSPQKPKIFVEGQITELVDAIEHEIKQHLDAQSSEQEHLEERN